MDEKSFDEFWEEQLEEYKQGIKEINRQSRIELLTGIFLIILGVIIAYIFNL